MSPHFDSVTVYFVLRVFTRAIESQRDRWVLEVVTASTAVIGTTGPLRHCHVLFALDSRARAPKNVLSTTTACRFARVGAHVPSSSIATIILPRWQDVNTNIAFFTAFHDGEASEASECVSPYELNPLLQRLSTRRHIAKLYPLDNNVDNDGIRLFLPHYEPNL